MMTDLARRFSVALHGKKPCCSYLDQLLSGMTGALYRPEHAKEDACLAAHATIHSHT